MSAQAISWIVGGGRVFTPSPFGLMGIVNLTPDSFFDGGKHTTAQSALEHAIQLVADGADILDLGAESSRPGADAVTDAIEISRLMPALTSILEHFPPHLAHSPLISVDTYHARTAHLALEAGVHIINDITACREEPALLDIIASYKPGYVLMHSQGKPKTMQVAPHYDDIISEMMAFFSQKLHMLTQAGLPESHIAIDPGIGFGKNLEHNLTILHNLKKFQSLGRPLLMALSMKSFFRDLLGLHEANHRDTATQVTTALLASRGVVLHRVHDVRTTIESLRIVSALSAQA